MAKFTKKQTNTITEFTQAVVNSVAWEKWSIAAFKEDDFEEAFRCSDLQVYFAERAVKIARELGMTDEQITSCHYGLLIRGETTEAAA